MADEERLTVADRRKYLRRMAVRYRKAGRAERGQLLTEMEAVTGMHRKSLIRLLNAPTLARKARKKGRGHTYGPGVARVAYSVIGSVAEAATAPSYGNATGGELCRTRSR
jgi:hypothetical protein